MLALRVATPAEAIAAIDTAFGPENDSDRRFARPLRFVVDRTDAPAPLRVLWPA